MVAGVARQTLPLNPQREMRGAGKRKPRVETLLTTSNRLTSAKMTHRRRA
jgi:hypothetical protein